MVTRKKTVIAIDETERCANCKHFGLDEGMHVCKRYPRQFMPDGEDVSMCYPPHNPDDVCGEFCRKVNA
jgi:hypothetical protein